MKKIKKIENEELERFKKEIEELKIGWQRTQADFENFRRHVDEDRLNTIKFANTDLILDLIPVLDNFQRALSHKPKELENNNYVKGLEHIKTQLEQVLSARGVKKLEIKPGDKFDPNFQEAISSEKNADFKSGQIITVLEDGYILNDKLIRAAKVTVAK